MCMYVFEICAEVIFVTFPWWLENVKSRSKIALFSMSAILKFDFQKREQLRFSEVTYLNYTKKDPILHVATTFSLKQGETRTSHGPIPHPLNHSVSGKLRGPLIKTSGISPKLTGLTGPILPSHNRISMVWTCEVVVELTPWRMGKDKLTCRRYTSNECWCICMISNSNRILVTF